jgi:hypothetical protein
MPQPILRGGHIKAQPFPSFSKGGVRGGLSEMSQPIFQRRGQGWFVRDVPAYFPKEGSEPDSGVKGVQEK